MHAYYSERILAARRRSSRSRPPPACTTSGSTAPATTAARQRRAIPMAARILAAADAFAAMVRPRPHRPALAAEQAAGELTAEAEAGRLDHDAAAAVLAEAGQQVRRRRRHGRRA